MDRYLLNKTKHIAYKVLGYKKDGDVITLEDPDTKAVFKIPKCQPILKRAGYKLVRKNTRNRNRQKQEKS